MKTEVLRVGDARALDKAATYIRDGASIIIPTETVYGLSCDALNDSAVKDLFAIKGRDLAKQSAIFLADKSQIMEFALIESEVTSRIIGQYLPGPLTVILQSSPNGKKIAPGASGKIGIRISSNQFVNRLIGLCKVPLIATSANRSGEDACRTKDELLGKFKSTVPLIIYEQAPLHAMPSTVVDLSGEIPALIREGTIPFSELLNCARAGS